MSAHRFFSSATLAIGSEPAQILLSDDDIHHAVDVLRLRVGELIEVVSQGEAAHARLVKLSKVTRAGIWGVVMDEVPLGASMGLSLIQGMLKGEKMDIVARQATELGVDGFEPVCTERSIVRVEGAKATARCVRWRKIARAAAMQSHAPRVPDVAEVSGLDEACARALDRGTVIVLSERVGLPLLYSCSALLAPDHVSLVIGPEGGLSEREEARLAEAGAVFASLGERILRAETAAVSAVAIAACARIAHRTETAEKVRSDGG